MSETAEDRKRKRLEAWRRRRQHQQLQAPAAPKLSISFLGKKRKKDGNKPVALKKRKNHVNPFFDDTDEASGANDEFNVDPKSREKIKKLGFTIDDQSKSKQQSTQKQQQKQEQQDSEHSPQKRQKPSRRWDKLSNSQKHLENMNGVDDELDKFMEKLQSEAFGDTITGQEKSNDLGKTEKSNIRGSIIGKTYSITSGGVITSEEIEEMTGAKNKESIVNEDKKTNKEKNQDRQNQRLDTKSDLISNVHSTIEGIDDEQEEEARRTFIEALKSASPYDTASQLKNGKDKIKYETNTSDSPVQLAAEVRSEKHRREQRLRELEKEAESARQSAEASSAPDLGRLYNDVEGGVMEEAERNLDAAMAAPDALTVLAELNKKKELKAVNHSKMDYLPFKKNLYVVPRKLANLENYDIVNLRAKLKVRVRGHGTPAPVSTFEECGLSEKFLRILQIQNIHKPFAVQAQCIPCIMAGRDVIGIAKTGSGKTLAYLLPMLRHIGVQPALAPHESGPIGLVLAPARELAHQIHLVAKVFAKHVGLKSTAVYGGAAVAEQIADLKRGAHIVVATPGRLIDILTMQSGKILSLERVTFVVMDEADRMYDMGFAPQITAILAAVRPERQTVLFSATFPKAIESLARKSLKFPVEIIVGGRSVASDSVKQYAELIEEDEKFLRLLQLLGEHVEGTKKVVVFLDTQVRTDNLFEKLLRNGYSSLSLHGGKEQEDRDSTIYDFKRKDGPNVLVATGVAGRGLDVPACVCVINYSAPNHLEAYVHQVGRTGRAGNKGTSYTFVNSTDEAKYAPIVVRALSEAGQSENISSELKNLSDLYKEKVEKGEAKYAGSGFKGKGYSYDASEMNDAQKLVRLEKRQALIEAGLLDPDEGEPTFDDLSSSKKNTSRNDTNDAKIKSLIDNTALANRTENRRNEPEQNENDLGAGVPGGNELQTRLTPALLALPGMKDAILRRAGITKEPDHSNDPSLGHPVKMGSNHYLQEFEINDYPREARWKVTQRETTSRLQDEFQTAVTLKGEYFAPNRNPTDGERRLYLHLEATSERILQNCVLEIQRLLNEETLRVGSRGLNASSHKYNVLG